MLPPEYLRDPELSTENFRRQLKTFPFAQYWRWHLSALETLVPVRSINLLFTLHYRAVKMDQAYCNGCMCSGLPYHQDLSCVPDQETACYHGEPETPLWVTILVKGQTSFMSHIQKCHSWIQKSRHKFWTRK